MSQQQLSPQLESIYQHMIENGFKDRQSQRTMMHAIEAAFSGNKTSSNKPSGGLMNLEVNDVQSPICMIEAGTGTGKTFAYLLPLIPIAKAQEKSIIVSTGTIALQEQLVNQDIPALIHFSGLDFSVAIAKGRRNYLCLSKLEQEDSDDMIGGKSFHANSIQKIKPHLANPTWTGDFDSLPFPIPVETRMALSTDSNGCSNRKCNHFSDCHVMKAKDRVMNADVVVANHAMLISDLNIDKGGIFLPKHEDCFHVIDEAHHLPSEVVSRSSNQHLINGAIEWTAALIKFLNKDHGNADANQIARGLMANQKKLESIADSLVALWSWVNDQQFFEDQAILKELNYRFINGVLPNDVQSIGEKIFLLSDSVQISFEDAIKTVRDVQNNSSEPAKELLQFQINLSFWLDKINNLTSTWKMMVELKDKDETPLAKWLTFKKNDTDEMVDAFVCASLVNARDFLSQKLWSQTAGVVLTSATLSTLGNFDFYKSETALDNQTMSCEHQLLSPFDYKHRAILEIPKEIADPSNSKAHTDSVIKWCNKNLESDEAVLILCTSNSQLKQLKQGLSAKFNLLVQGDAPRTTLIDLHKKAIDNKQGSVLLGLDSLGEGLNLPGDYLTHVVIAKLPFSVPSDPVQKERMSLLEAQGRNPFAEISVPEATRKLTQWVGRLLRTEEDAGVVSILDPRLKTKNYGKAMIKSLPPMNLIIH